MPIAERFGMDPGAVLDNVSIFPQVSLVLDLLFTIDWTSLGIGRTNIFYSTILKDHLCACVHIRASVQPAPGSSSQDV